METERRRTPISALLTANTISLVGSTLTIVALPWFVLQTTGSPARAGLVGFAATIPRFLSGIFGGTIIDRVGPKRVSILADSMGALGIAVIPLLYDTVGLAFWQLLLLVFLGNLLNLPGLTARRAILPELADLAQVRLERVNSAFETITSLSRLLGAPLAGLLVVLMGANNVLWIDAATYLVSAVTMAVAVPAPSDQASTETTEGYWRQLAAGVRFLRRDSVLLWMAITLMVNNPFVNALTPVILPVFARARFGSATDLGLILASLSAGAVLGGILYGLIGSRISRRFLFLFSYLMSPLEFWAILAQPSLLVLIPILFAVGVAVGPVNPLMVTVRHERIPLEMRGRVFSLYSAMAVAGIPLGIAFAGYSISAVGLQPTVLAFAVIAQISGIVLLFVPALRDMGPRMAEDATVGAVA